MNLIKLVIVAIFVFSVASCSKAEQPLPQGWKLLVFDTHDDWRKEDPSRYTIIRGDFNGDGIQDTARLLEPEDGAGIGLFVFISTGKDKFKTYLLDEMKDPDSVHSKGIRKVSPGIYKTACGKGYWPCGKDEVPEISIRYDAIDYFKTESASSYIYWDTQTSTFKRIWISD